MFLCKDRLQLDESSKFVLVEDTAQQCGRHVLQSLVESWAKGISHINYLNYDLPRERVVKYYKSATHPMNFIHLFSEDAEAPCGLEALNVIKKRNGKTVAFIDSLYPVLADNHPLSVYRSIYDFTHGSPKCQLVALLHTDCHSENEIFMFESQASVVIKVLPNSDEDGRCGILITIHPDNGKVTQETYDCHFNEKGSITSLKVAKRDTSSSAANPKQGDPTADLTFNLKLSELERKVKVSVPSPFTDFKSEELSGSFNDYCEDSVDDYSDDEC